MLEGRAWLVPQAILRQHGIDAAPFAAWAGDCDRESAVDYATRRAGELGPEGGRPISNGPYLRLSSWQLLA
eukprot:13322887-Alexandrium_andersonii.AAC.1